MSYSFSVKGATKDEALALVASEMEGVVKGQPVHAADGPMVNAAAKAATSILKVEADKSVYISINGSVSCNDWSSPEKQLESISGVSFNLSASSY